MSSKNAVKLPRYLKMKIHKKSLNYEIQPWRFRNYEARNYGRSEVPVPPVRVTNPRFEPKLISEKLEPVKLYNNEALLKKLSSDVAKTDAKVDLLFLLEQIDINRRRARINIPDFCVGSIVKVVYHMQSSASEYETFTGLCIKQSPSINTLGHTFTLMNAFNNTINVRMTFYTYDVKMKSIEVLRHSWMTHDQVIAFRQLPPKYNNHALIEPVPYTKEPFKFKFSAQDEHAVRKYLEDKIVSIVMRERPRDRNFRESTNDTSFTHPKPHWINLK